MTIQMIQSLMMKQKLFEEADGEDSDDSDDSDDEEPKGGKSGPGFEFVE